MINKHVSRNDFLSILYVYRNDYKMSFLYFCVTQNKPKGFYVCVENKFKEYDFMQLVHFKNNTK